MDLQFASKLQTAMHNLGRIGGFAPLTSQDPADTILHEYYIAETGRSLFDKRRKIALEEIKKLDNTGRIAQAQKDAAKGLFADAVFADTPNYTASVKLKTPTKQVDVTVLTNELIRLGVDQDTIRMALATATKTNKSAETYTVSVKVT